MGKGPVQLDPIAIPALVSPRGRRGLRIERNGLTVNCIGVEGRHGAAGFLDVDRNRLRFAAASLVEVGGGCSTQPDDDGCGLVGSVPAAENTAPTVNPKPGVRMGLESRPVKQGSNSFAIHNLVRSSRDSCQSSLAGQRRGRAVSDARAQQPSRSAGAHDIVDRDLHGT